MSATLGTNHKEDLNINKTLLSLSIITVNYNSNVMFIDSFVPFVATLINEMGYQSPTQVMNNFESKYGISVPYHAIVTILDRAYKKGYFNKINGKLVPIEEKICEEDMSDLSEQQIRKYEKVLNSFIEYTKKEHSSETKEISAHEAEKALISFIDQYDLDLFRKEHIPEHRFNSEINFILNKFMIYANKYEPLIQGYIEEIVLGHVLLNTLFYTCNEKNYTGKSLKGLNVYIDSNIIFIILGFAKEERRIIYEEFLSQLSENHADLYLFEHNYYEVINGLYNCHHWINNTEFDYSKASMSARYCVENHLSKSQVLDKILKIDKILEENMINRCPNPDYNEKKEYNINHNEFREIIIDTYKKTNPSFNEEEKSLTIDYDVQSIAYIHLLRENNLSIILKDVKHLFVTTNSALTLSNKIFENKNQGENIAIPACLTDLHLGTMVWLLSPAKFTEFNKKKLMAECYAAIKPNVILLKRYQNELSKLLEDKKICEEHVYLLRASSEALNMLQEKTMGDPNKFTDKTAIEIYEELKGELVTEEAAKLEDEKNKHAETQDELRDIMEKYRAAENQKDKLTKVNSIASNRLTNIIYWALMIILFFIVYGIYTLNVLDETAFRYFALINAALYFIALFLYPKNVKICIRDKLVRKLLSE